MSVETKVKQLHELPKVKARKEVQTIKKELKEHYTTDASLKKAYSEYRGELRKLAKSHYLIPLFKLTKFQLERLNKEYKKELRKRHSNIHTITKYKEYIKYAEDIAINSASYVTRLLGLCALTGRRPAELMKTAHFRKVKDDSYKAYFTGQLKTKNAKKEEYIIPLLTNYDLVQESLESIRPHFNDVDTTKQAIARVSTRITLHMGKMRFKEFLKPKLQSRDLRKAYSAIAYFLVKEEITQTPEAYTAQILGHSDDDLTTALSYRDYIVKDNGVHYL